MSSETSMVATNFHLQEWTTQIRECQDRLAGISVEGWCASHGITKANYYYRLRRMREACLEGFEYSCAVKPHIRAGGNRQSGIWETAIASLLA